MNKIKEFFSDPKKKSLTLLGIYALFFILVFVLINIGENNDSKNVVVKPKEEEKIISSYNYKIDINAYDSATTVTGSYNNNIYTFDYNGVTYVYKDNKTYLNNNIVEDVFEIEEYSYANIENLIKYSESETTYKGSTRITYSINMTEYISDNLQKNGIYDVSGGILKLTIEKDNYIKRAIFEYDNGLIVDVYYSNFE